MSRSDSRYSTYEPSQTLPVSIFSSRVPYTGDVFTNPIPTPIEKLVPVRCQSDSPGTGCKVFTGSFSRRIIMEVASSRSSTTLSKSPTNK